MILMLARLEILVATVLVSQAHPWNVLPPINVIPLPLAILLPDFAVLLPLSPPVRLAKMEILVPPTIHATATEFVPALRFPVPLLIVVMREVAILQLEIVYLKLYRMVPLVLLLTLVNPDLLVPEVLVLEETPSLVLQSNVKCLLVIRLLVVLMRTLPIQPVVMMEIAVRQRTLVKVVCV